MRNPNWTKQEDEILIKNYPSCSLSELNELLPGRNENGIKVRQSFLGVCKKYTKDDKFFETPNELNSSVAGILASDGHVSFGVAKKRSARVCLGMNTKDKIILEQFAEAAKCNYKITSTSKKQKIKTNRMKKESNYICNFSSLHVSRADKWAEDLKRNWNIPTGAKSLILEPPQNLTDINHCLAFISGLITGDGTILLTELKRGEPYIKISLLGTERLLLWVKKIFSLFLNDELENNNVIKERENSNIFILNITGYKAETIIDKINTLNIIKLERKWCKPEILALIAEHKEKGLNPYFLTYNNTMKHKLETNGRENDGRPMLLEQVWGKTDMSRYQTLDESEYTNTISNMTRADLEAHARKMGVPVCEGSLRLRDMLINEFRSYCAMLSVPKSNLPSKKDFSSEALKIMNEGR